MSEDIVYPETAGDGHNTEDANKDSESFTICSLKNTSVPLLQKMVDCKQGPILGKESQAGSSTGIPLHFP